MQQRRMQLSTERFQGQTPRRSVELIRIIITVKYYDLGVPPGSMVYRQAVAVDDNDNEARSAAQSSLYNRSPILFLVQAVQDDCPEFDPGLSLPLGNFMIVKHSTTHRNLTDPCSVTTRCIHFTKAFESHRWRLTNCSVCTNWEVSGSPKIITRGDMATVESM